MNPELVFHQGAAAFQAGDLRTAERLFQSIVDSHPDAHPAWNALALVAVRLGYPKDAVRHAKRALELDRRNPIYLNNLGIAHAEVISFSEAENCFRRALKIAPDYTEAMFNLGKVLFKQARLAEAIRAFERAYAMNKNFPGLAYGLAHAYRQAGRADAGRRVLEGAMPGLGHQGLTAIADCIGEVEGIDAKIRFLREALQRQPGNRWIDFLLSVELLTTGRWAEGWRRYVARRLPEARDTLEPFPERANGRLYLLVGEQGLGDQLFFLRFAPLLHARGARIAFVCERRLASLLQASAPVIERFCDAAVEADWQPYDEKLLIGDLPLRLACEHTPPAWPSLSPHADRVARSRAKLDQLGPPPYLGVTWRAGFDPHHRRETGNEIFVYTKVVPPEQLGAALRGWPGTVLALQRELYPEEFTAFQKGIGSKVHDFSELAGDLEELLATLSLLDDYVTVSNTNIHLLAGMGRSAKVLLPYPAEWRWMQGDRSPWFPEFPLYRQPQSREWSQPLSQLRADLYGQAK